MDHAVVERLRPEPAVSPHFVTVVRMGQDRNALEIRGQSVGLEPAANRVELGLGRNGQVRVESGASGGYPGLQLGETRINRSAGSFQLRAHLRQPRDGQVQADRFVHGEPGGAFAGGGPGGG